MPGLLDEFHFDGYHAGVSRAPAHLDLAGVAAVLPPLRRGGGETLRDAAQQRFGGPVRVIRGGGRRRGATEALVAELLGSGVMGVVIESLRSLNPVPAKALAALASMMSAGLVVTSIADPWTTACDAQTLTMVSSFLVAAEKAKSSRAGHSAIAVARAQDRRIGRPRRTFDVERARVLVEQHGFRRAARELGVGATTIRRALRAA